MHNLPVEMIVGKTLGDLSCKPLRPYSSESIEFLVDLSKVLLSIPEARAHPDIVAFGYWCRRAHLSKLARSFDSRMDRVGRGLAFHVAPANVPVNFAFSMAFGMLSGNANIIRISDAYHLQAKIICREVSRLFERGLHPRVAGMLRIIKYPRNDQITAAISGASDVRILWGGDSTIANLRSMSTKPRCIDISFADRYSICILGAESILNANDLALRNLAISFYNDVYLLDQNACSSPHLIIWQGTEKEIEKAMLKFWSAIEENLMLRAEPPAIHASEKFNHMCRIALQMDDCVRVTRHKNLIYRVHLKKIPNNIERYRGSCGFFFEVVDNDFSQLRCAVNERFQTATYFGVEPNKLINLIQNDGLIGIDRVVPIGKALDIGVFWDGYDLIATLSRVISRQ